MKKILPSLALLVSSIATAQTYHVSPEVKIGPYKGAGIQLGVADTLGMDAVFISYARKNYNAGRYDESIDSYRIGLQHMFGDRDNYGLQAEIGIADYRGTYSRNDTTTSRRDQGLSIGASYVYMLNDSFGLKTGFDYDMFSAEKTYITLDSNFSINFGVVGRF